MGQMRPQCLHQEFMVSQARKMQQQPGAAGAQLLQTRLLPCRQPGWQAPPWLRRQSMQSAWVDRLSPQVHLLNSCTAGLVMLAAISLCHTQLE